MSPWREVEEDGSYAYRMWTGTVMEAVRRADGWRGSPWQSLRVLYDHAEHSEADGVTEQSPWELYEMVYSRGVHGSFLPKDDGYVGMDPGVAEQLTDAVMNLMEDVRQMAPRARTRARTQSQHAALRKGTAERKRASLSA